MIRQPGRGRSGITLTEILISIMIMGVGVISIASLFPIGLSRLQQATRLTRSAFLFKSAGQEMLSRNLLSKASFLNLNISPWYGSASTGYYDPWIQDTPKYGSDWPGGSYRGNGGTGAPNAANTTPLYGAGLPVAYDPLWRWQTLSPSTGAKGCYLGDTAEARFGAQAGDFRADPDGGPASADGLPRLTNLSPGVASLWSAVPYIFVSPEDIVLNDSSSKTSQGFSPVLPDLSIGNSVQLDWRYTWMFTGAQSSVGTYFFPGSVGVADSSNFDGDIVVFENRPFGINPTPYGSYQAEGERVVEAIFGYSANVQLNGGSAGFALGSDNVVLLRWPAKDPDPEIKVGKYVADVTYTRLAQYDISRRLSTVQAGATNNGQKQASFYQRCHWYQITKKAAAGPDVVGDAASGSYRSMMVWVGTPLQEKTLLTSSGTPVHVNTALVSPYVVNVNSMHITTR